MTRVITPAEAEALVKFRERIPDLLSTFRDHWRHDLWLIRWIRDKELNVEKAEDRLRKHLEWLEFHGMNHVLKLDLPEYIDETFVYHVPGFDKEDYVLAIHKVGLWKIKQMLELGYKDGFILWMKQIIVQALAFMEHRSTPEKFLNKFVIILDLDGFPWSQLTSKQAIELFLFIGNQYRHQYPDTLNAGWVLNSPKMFHVLYRMATTVLSPKTLKRCQVYGHSGWREPLLKTIDAEYLPSNYGGSNTTCLPYKVKYGFNMPEPYHTFNESEFTKIVLDPGQKCDLSHYLQTDQFLSWNFRSDDFDIGYKVEFRKAGMEDCRILFECPDTDSHLYLQKGRIQADQPGTYSLVLDNFGSGTKVKNIYYAIKSHSQMIIPIEDTES